VASLSPWPEEFGLGRMQALLESLGDPQRSYPSVHVVGTNGKSTAARTIAALLRADGLDPGVYTSPHVAGWHERLDSDPDELERALARVRPEAERLGATQFEVLTAAAFAEFAARGVDVAVVEAGLGGRLDATNVIDAPVVHLTNVSLEHVDVLGDTREQIAREKLAVVKPGAAVVLGEAEWEPLAWERGARAVVRGGAREAAETFAGHVIDGEPEVLLPGRFERRGGEVWDGAHTPEGVDWLLARLPAGEWVVLASVLADKDVEGILRRLARVGRTLVATRSTNARALGEKELAARGEPYFERVETIADPAAALARARELGRVLATGSLYLLADLYPSG
jgi:dihydrofolate synthase/folylpolyglutamate synthase